MMLFVFGQFVIAAAFIVWAYSEHAWRNRQPISIWNASLLMAMAMAMGTAGMALVLGVRAIDILSGIPLPTERPYIYMFGWGMVITSLTMLVWVAALREGRAYSQGLWLSYIACSFAWGLFCIGEV